MGRATVYPLYDATSAAGGALTSAIIETGGYDEVIAYAIAGGAAAPATQPTAREQEASGTVLWTSPALTLGVAGTGRFSWGPGGVQALGTTGLHLGPVPARISLAGTGGAASTIRFAVFGFKRDARDANP